MSGPWAPAARVQAQGSRSWAPSLRRHVERASSTKDPLEPLMRTIPLTLALAASTLSAQAPSYHISRTYPLGGDGGWDYIVPDPAAQRVYIGRANRVMVVDAND